MQSFALIERLKRYYGCGIWAGKLFCLCVVVDYLIYILLEIFAPRSRIDLARNWPKKELREGRDKDDSAMKEPSGIGRKRSARHRREKKEAEEES